MKLPVLALLGGQFKVTQGASIIDHGHYRQNPPQSGHNGQIHLVAALIELR